MHTTVRRSLFHSSKNRVVPVEGRVRRLGVMGSRSEPHVAIWSMFFAFTIIFQTKSSAADLLSPILNGSCTGVQCGKGSCKVSSNISFLGLPLGIGYFCECDPGWTRISMDDGLKFLPCVIPNCTLNYSCSPGLPASPPSAPPPPSDLLHINLCSFALCREGACARTSNFSYRCDCKPGYDNLLNISILPCFRSCVIGADCANLGIGPFVSPPSAPPQLQSNASAGSRSSNEEMLLQLTMFFSMIFLLSV